MLSITNCPLFRAAIAVAFNSSGLSAKAYSEMCSAEQVKERKPPLPSADTAIIPAPLEKRNSVVLSTINPIFRAFIY